MIRLPAFWRRHFLKVEFSLAAVITVGVAIYILRFGGDDGIVGVVAGERSDIYRTAASVAAALLGFLIAAVSVMLGFVGSERLTPLRRSQRYRDLFAIFFGGIRSLALLALASFVGLLIDSQDPPRLWIEMIFLFLAILSALRIVRVIWVLEQVVVIVAGATRGRGEG